MPTNDLRGYGGFARVMLTHLPTPLEPMSRLSAELGTRLHIKRDDCTGLAMGGNKARKLEYVFAQALAAGHDTVITSGSVQSNHVRQTAAAAAKFGLRCRLVISNPIDCDDAAWLESGNFHLDLLYGAQVDRVLEAESDDALAAIAESERQAGHSVYVIPVGASDGLGSLGYAQCADEMLAQFAAQQLDVSHIVLATGSAGTHAGLLHGLRAAGSDIAVVGISVSEPAAVKCAKVRRVSDEIARVLGVASPVPDADIVVHDDYVGGGYAQPSLGAHEAILRLARTEAVLIDPVYTAKAFSGLLDLAGRRALGDTRDVVFLHTGGTPALFSCVDIDRRTFPGSFP